MTRGKAESEGVKQTWRASGQVTPLRLRGAAMASRSCSARRGNTGSMRAAHPADASASAMSPIATNPGPRLLGVLHCMLLTVIYCFPPDKEVLLHQAITRFGPKCTLIPLGVPLQQSLFSKFLQTSNAPHADVQGLSKPTSHSALLAWILALT